MAKDDDKFFDTGKKGPTLKYCYAHKCHDFKDGLICVHDDKELKAFCEEHNFANREQPKQKAVKLKKGDKISQWHLDKITPSFWYNGICYYTSHKTLDYMLDKFKDRFAKVGNDKPRHPCYFKPIIIKQEEYKKTTKKRQREIKREAKAEHQQRLMDSANKISKALSKNSNKVKRKRSK